MTTNVYGFRKILQVSVAHPLGFEVFAYSFIVEAKPPSLSNRVAVRFELGGPLYITVIWVEKLPAFHKLLDMTELVD